MLLYSSHYALVKRVTLATSIAALSSTGIGAPVNYPMATLLTAENSDVHAFRDWADYSENISLQSEPRTIEGGVVVNSFPQVRYIHVLPDSLTPSRDRVTGAWEFQQRPVYDSQGRFSELIIDFNLETNLSDYGSHLVREVLFPNATVLFPIAVTSSFEELGNSDHVKVIRSTADTPILSMIGLKEPVRLRIDAKGLRDYRCALEGLDRLNKTNADRGIQSVDANALSILTGSLRQTYSMLRVSPTTPDAPIDSTVYHNIVARLGDNDMAEGSFSSLLFETVRHYSPRCFYQSRTQLDQAAYLPGMALLIQMAQALQIDFFDLILN